MHEAALKPMKIPTGSRSFTPVRVIRRKMASYSAIPPLAEEGFHKAVLDEILEERAHSQAATPNLRAVKAQDEHFPLDRATPSSCQRSTSGKAIRIIK